MPVSLLDHRLILAHCSPVPYGWPIPCPSAPGPTPECFSPCWDLVLCVLPEAGYPVAEARPLCPALTSTLFSPGCVISPQRGGWFIRKFKEKHARRSAS